MKDTFGGREVVRDKCFPEDFTSRGKPIPKRIDKYVMAKCLNCGNVFPMLKRNLSSKNCRCSECILKNDFVKIDDKLSKIVVTCHYGTFEYFVDTYNLDMVSQYRWRIAIKRRKMYLITGTPKKKTAIYLHQMIYGEEVPKGYTIDHDNCNEFDNTRQNLKCVTIAENAQNVSARFNNRLGVRGIWYDDSRKLYGCELTMNGISFYFKSFKTIEEAVLCRLIAEQFFGLKIAERNPIVQDILKDISYSDKEDMRIYVTRIIERKMRENAKDNQESR